VTRDGPAASKRPASEIIRTRRNSVACNTIVRVGVRVRVCCVFMVIHTYTTTYSFIVIMAPERE